MAAKAKAKKKSTPVRKTARKKKAAPKRGAVAPDAGPALDAHGRLLERLERSAWHCGGAALLLGWLLHDSGGPTPAALTIPTVLVAALAGALPVYFSAVRRPLARRRLAIGPLLLQLLAALLGFWLFVWAAAAPALPIFVAALFPAVATFVLFRTFASASVKLRTSAARVRVWAALTPAERARWRAASEARAAARPVDPETEALAAARAQGAWAEAKYWFARITGIETPAPEETRAPRPDIVSE